VLGGEAAGLSLGQKLKNVYLPNKLYYKLPIDK
jgi:hypothetical protein